MKPRLAPCKEYFPALSWENAKWPSSEVITEVTFPRSTVSAIEMRAWERGAPVIAFTTLPEIINDWAAGEASCGAVAWLGAASAAPGNNRASAERARTEPRMREGKVTANRPSG